jgi:hypothetical protein
MSIPCAMPLCRLEFGAGTNDSELVPIAQSLCRWTRLTLVDGTAARLVETL